MKKTLRQYNSLIQEIKELNEEIEKMKNKKYSYEKDSVTGSNAEFPYQAMNYNIEGIVPVDTTVKESMLTKRLNKCEELKIDIERFISDIPDSLTRRVFRYRYIEGLEWRPIARRIGRHDESYPRKMIHDRYLERIKPMR
ncbi:hypothetical protein [Tissierella creatinophila]|uniref:Uncharacterized protein n=1 Tax=Tissierella creatinophila DSM 6911 TaxID=1123403 RepID=A0A1U7M519_TISCR|nr:hypothetical protein [Tissierella creatinophila]OLS02412.1 hypothetical protein TICRE_16010 [Tissierella creatinophila DSM 6911]